MADYQQGPRKQGEEENTPLKEWEARYEAARRRAEAAEDDGLPDWQRARAAELDAAEREEREATQQAQERAVLAEQAEPAVEASPLAEPAPYLAPAQQKITTRGLAEAAMMIAIAVILSLVTTYVPFLSMIAMFVYPLPFAFIVLRYGLKLGLLCVVATFALSALILGPLQSAMLLLMYGIMGLFLGWSFRKGKKQLVILTGTALFAALGLGLMVILSVWVSGIPFMEMYDQVLGMMDGYVTELSRQNPDMVFLGGMSASDYSAYLLETMQRVLPSAFIAFAMFMAMICYFIFRRLAGRLGYPVDRLPAFTEWRLDWRFLWGAILAFGTAGFGELLKIDWLLLIGDNLQTIVQPVFMLCGIALVAWLFRRWRASAIVKVLLVFLALQMFGITLNALFFIGILDPIFDFRARLRQIRPADSGEQTK